MEFYARLSPAFQPRLGLNPARRPPLWPAAPHSCTRRPHFPGGQPPKAGIGPSFLHSCSSASFGRLRLAGQRRPASLRLQRPPKFFRVGGPSPPASVLPG